MQLSDLELIALDIRRAAVEKSNLTGTEALLAIVAPGPELYAISIRAAQKRRADRGQVTKPRPPKLTGWL